MKNINTNNKLTNFNEEEMKSQKMKFCILTSFKSQFCRSNLLMFTLDKHV